MDTSFLVKQKKHNRTPQTNGTGGTKMGNNLTEQMDVEPAQDMDPLAIDNDSIKFSEVYIKTENFPSEEDHDPSYCDEPQHILPVSADIQLKEEDISEDDEAGSMYPDSGDAFEPFSIVGGKQPYSKGMCCSCSTLNRYSTPPNETPLEREQRIRRKYHTFHRILKLPDELRDQKWACRCPPELGSSAIRKQLSRCIEDYKHFRSYISRYDTPPRESKHERNRRIARKNQAIYMYRQKMRSNGIVYTMKSKNDKSSNSSARAQDREEYFSIDSVSSARTLNKKNNSIAQLSSKIRYKNTHRSERPLISGYETPPDETKEERKRRLDRRNQAICRYRRKLMLTGKMQTKKSNNDKTCPFNNSALASDDEEDMGNNSETSNSDEEDLKNTQLSEPPLPSGYETPPEETKEERRRRLARKNQAMYLYRKKLRLFGELQAKKSENDKSCTIANSENASNVEEDLTNYSETLKTEQQINNSSTQLPSTECSNNTHLVRPPVLSGYETPPEETKKERRRRLVRKNQAIYWYRKKLRLIGNNVHTTQSKNDKSSTSNKAYPSLRPLISGYETPPEETKEQRKRRLARKHQAIYLYRKKLKLTRNASNHPHLSVRPQLSGYETPPDETKEERKRRLARKHQAIYLFRKKIRLTGKVQTKRSKNDKTCTSNNATLASDDYLAKNSKASKSLVIKINSIAQLSSIKRSKNTHRSELPLISGYETPPNETKEERKRRLDRRNQAICRYRKKLRLTGNVLTIKSEKEETCTSNNSEMAASDNGEEKDLAVDSEALKSVLTKISSVADSSDEENSSKTNIFEPPLVSGYETPPDETKEERKRRLARKSQAICRYRKKLRLTGNFPAKISENDKSCTSYNSEFAAYDDEEDLANDSGASNLKFEENNSITQVHSEEYSKKKYFFEPLLLSGYETPPDETKEERKRRLARKSQAICRYRKRLRLTGNFPAKISENDKSCTSYNSEFAASDDEEDLVNDSGASNSKLEENNSITQVHSEEYSKKKYFFEPLLLSGYETPPDEKKEERKRRLARKSQAICRYRKRLRLTGNFPAKISENDKSCTSYNSEFAASDDEEDLVNDSGASNSKLEENNSITQVHSKEYSSKTNHFEPPLVSGYETPPEETREERRRRLARKSQAICRYRKKLRLTGNVNTTKSENDKNWASNNSKFAASDDDAEDLAVYSKSDEEYSNNTRLSEPLLVSGYKTPPEETKEERKRRLARKSQAICRYRKKLRLIGTLPAKISENDKSCTSYNSEFAASDDEEDLANDSEPSKSDEECSKNANFSDQLLVSGYEIPPDAMKEERKQLRLTGSVQEKKLENDKSYFSNNSELASDDEEGLANESETSKEHEEDTHLSEPPLPSGYETPPEETKEERRRRLARKYQAMYLYRKKLRLTSKSESDKTSTSNNAHLSVRPHICGYETPPDETKEERKRRIARRNQAIYRYRQMLKLTGNVHIITSEDDKTSTFNNTHPSETRRKKSESED
ncbi:uncharacterized protein LOC121594502 isoform X1 [Anopheles merus]|uniref:uncharacterized protein LOC121594502 isoform X1 n=1 Tax=Anopheles merus TaxID=30066 RepID=UPI001BE48A24|nr:uncharacterized protein LOC121594502 isoform X1 [Anopheles merus]